MYFQFLISSLLVVMLQSAQAKPVGSEAVALVDHSSHDSEFNKETRVLLPLGNIKSVKARSMVYQAPIAASTASSSSLLTNSVAPNTLRLGSITPPPTCSGQLKLNAGGTDCVCVVTGAVLNPGTGSCELSFCPKNEVTIFNPGFFIIPGVFVKQSTQSCDCSANIDTQLIIYDSNTGLCQLRPCPVGSVTTTISRGIPNICDCAPYGFVFTSTPIFDRLANKCKAPSFICPANSKSSIQNNALVCTCNDPEARFNSTTKQCIVPPCPFGQVRSGGVCIIPCPFGPGMAPNCNCEGSSAGPIYIRVRNACGPVCYPGQIYTDAFPRCHCPDRTVQAGAGNCVLP